MAAPSLRSLGTAVATTTSTPSFAAPAGAVANDVILIGTFIDDGRTTVSAVPSGFTLAAGTPQINDVSLGSPSHGLYVYWGRFGSVGTGPYAFTLSASVFVEGRTAAIQGCVTSGNPFEATNGATSGNTSVTTAPSVTATSLDIDRYAFYVATNWTGGAWTPATGFAEQWDANDEICTFDDKTLSTAQTVTPQAVCAGSNKSNAWVGILLPDVASIPPLPLRTVATRDPGEVWWLQRDRRDAVLVGSAANPLVSPLDSAWQADARYWHLYADPIVRDRTVYYGYQRPRVVDQSAAANDLLPPLLAGDGAHQWHRYNDIAQRSWMPQQRAYYDPSLLTPAGSDPLATPSGARHRQAAYADRRQTVPQRVYTDPSLLAAAELENELLGGGDTGRHRQPALFVDRREVPQQRSYYDLSLLSAAELENELLGGADTGRHRQAALFVDRRLVPQQRQYQSDPSLLTTALLEGALLGQADVARHAMWFTDRRPFPQQRIYSPVPTTALLELELLGGADTARHLTWFTDRRPLPAQRAYFDLSLLAAQGTDPLTVAAGVGGDIWRRANLPAYADRREVPQQPPRSTLYFDAGPGSPPLTLAWGAGGDLWHRYNPRRPARLWWPAWLALFPPASADICVTPRPGSGLTLRPGTGSTARLTGTTARPGSGTTARPDSGDTNNPC